jgi:hypothetical protein
MQTSANADDPPDTPPPGVARLTVRAGLDQSLPQSYVPVKTTVMAVLPIWYMATWW